MTLSDFRWLIVLSLPLAVCIAGPGCSDEKATNPAATSAGGSGGGQAGEGGVGGEPGGSGGGVEACVDSAKGSFPPQAEEVAHDPDEGTGTILDYMWNPFNGAEGTYTIGQEHMWEAVRFDLLAPATVYGARVMWGHLPGEGERAVTLGAYPDFGSNGFDFFRWEPLWTGERCLDPADNLLEWTDYVFDKPVEVDTPGLFYIASEFLPPDGPALAFQPDNIECDKYGDCRSAVNLPEADAKSYYNGISFPFPYNYSVRLMVEFHDTIAPEDKWFQEDAALSASGQVAWGDYDHDGWDDLLTNGPKLYRNNGDGSFTNVTTSAKLDNLSANTGGGVWGDFDNDGCLDFFAFGTNQSNADLLVKNNCDGTFSDVTAASGIDDTQSGIDCNKDSQPEHSPTPAAAWIDLDADGLLDLYLANYECSDPYKFYRDRFFHNEGAGKFTEWSGSKGFANVSLAGRGVSPIDVDRDGDVDIFVSNYRLNRNLMYENDGGTKVTERALSWGLAGEWIKNAYGHTIGSAWLDLEGDGDWDLIEANLAHPRFFNFSDKTMVLRNDGKQGFTDVAKDAGIFYRETHSNPTVQDFDNDGDTDLFITCVYEGRFSELYFNDGSGKFDQVNYESGAIIHNGWGSAASDFDNDGDVDLLAYKLFRNDSAAKGNHWLQVRVIGGVKANWAAIGAVVELDVGGKTLMNHVSGGSGTGCQDSMYLSFGLGAADKADAIRVVYPGGGKVTVAGPISADQRVWIYEDSKVTYGFAP